MNESKSSGFLGGMHFQRSTSNTLRHQTDFEVLSLLGRGGFGVVWKVRNLVDQGTYALKKIRLNKLYGSDNQANDTIMREVAALRQLHDPHIVRYFGAWIEAGDQDDENEEDSNGSLFSSTSIPKKLSPPSHSMTFRFDKDYLASASADDVPSVQNSSAHDISCAMEPDLQCNICHQWYGDWEVSFEEWSMLTSSLQPMNLCQTCYKAALSSIGVDLTRVHIRQKQKRPLYLFIQMEFCDANLYQELEYCGSMWEDDSATDSRSSRLWTLFREIVAGVCSMHSSAIAHRDLKPSNIFIQNGRVKIGDLGLAKDIISTKSDALAAGASGLEPTSLGQSFRSSGGLSNFSSGLTTCVGTYLYIAPEVLDKSQSPVYDQKCDIFALGIILLEMFQPFLTSMERVEALSAVRKRILPTGLEARHPGVCRLIALLTHPDPRKRPSARELMESFDTYSGLQVGGQVEAKRVLAPIHEEVAVLNSTGLRLAADMDDPLSARLEFQLQVDDLKAKLKRSEDLVALLRVQLAQQKSRQHSCLFCGC